MSAFDTATKFFHACESLEGWEGCKDYVADGASFSAQCEPLVDISTVEAYCGWVAGLGSGPLKGCVYEIHSSSYDEANRTALFFATLTGTHVGDGGPVAQAFYILNPKDPGGDSTDDVTATTEARKLAAIGRESTN